MLFWCFYLIQLMILAGGCVVSPRTWIRITWSGGRKFFIHTFPPPCFVELTKSPPSPPTHTLSPWFPILLSCRMLLSTNIPVIDAKPILAGSKLWNMQQTTTNLLKISTTPEFENIPDKMFVKNHLGWKIYETYLCKFSKAKKENSIKMKICPELKLS